MEDEDPAIRREALLAAVWTRQPWVLGHCRKLCAAPSPQHWDAIMLLAILGKPKDLPTILAIGRATELGPRRFQALGAYGHPAAVEMLLATMAGDDPAAAVAAAEAFTKITGFEVDSDRCVPLPPEDGSQPNADQPESGREAVLPDPKRARSHWQRVKANVSQWTRACRGFDLSASASEEALSQLDMRSRWETLCREHFEGTRYQSLVELEAMRIARPQNIVSP
jgi:hypothetical protein